MMLLLACAWVTAVTAGMLLVASVRTENRAVRDVAPSQRRALRNRATHLGFGSAALIVVTLVLFVLATAQASR